MLKSQLLLFFMTSIGGIYFFMPIYFIKIPNNYSFLEMLGEFMKIKSIKKVFCLWTILLITCSSHVLAKVKSSIELKDSRLKLQFRLDKDESEGLFPLREYIEKAGHEIKDFVFEGKTIGNELSTKDTYAPFAIYDFLYPNGQYVFTIFIPVTDDVFLSNNGSNPFLSLEGKSAYMLIRILKKAGENSLRFGEGSYCRKGGTSNPMYNHTCWIEL